MRLAAMPTYETFATVEDQGQIHVAGLPFAPGTEVEVTITALPVAASSTPGDEDVFAEMQAYMVDVPDVDDSRDAIYARMDFRGLSVTIVDPGSP